MSESNKRLTIAWEVTPSRKVPIMSNIAHWPRIATFKVLGQRNGVTRVDSGYVQGIVGVPGRECELQTWRVYSPGHACHKTLEEKFHQTEVGS